MPQRDEWSINKETGQKMFTSASFVASALEAVGAIGKSHNQNLNKSEFTVKDIYQLAIYDQSFEKPYDCITADPHIPYCQLMGSTRLYLHGFNMVKPYNRMNEKCPNLFVTESRPEHC